MRIRKRPAASIGSRIREFRKRRGMFQKELAQALRVSVGSVKGWESGRGMPALGRLPEIADALGCKASDLLSARRKDDGPPAPPVPHPFQVVIDKILEMKAEDEERKRREAERERFRAELIASQCRVVAAANHTGMTVVIPWMERLKSLGVNRCL